MTKEEFAALKAGDKILSTTGYEYKVVGPGTEAPWAKKVLSPAGRVSEAWSYDIYELVASESDPVTPEPGTHYKATPIEVWEAIEAWQSSWPPEIRYHVGSAIKYLGRLGRKEGAPVDSDLKKAVAFLERALKVFKREGT